MGNDRRNVMNHLPHIDLHRAMENADIDELSDAAVAIGQAAVHAVLAQRPPSPQAYKPSDEEERQRLADAALGDVVEMVARHRQRLGRRVCSISDAKVIRMAHELLRGMADASGGVDGDPSFQ
jgi:hypothetical protein